MRTASKIKGIIDIKLIFNLMWIKMILLKPIFPYLYVDGISSKIYVKDDSDYTCSGALKVNPIKILIIRPIVYTAINKISSS